MKPILEDNAVRFNQRRFNFNNKKEAETLYNVLMEYAEQVEINRETSEKLDRITRQVIQIQMSIKILDEEVKQLKILSKRGTQE